MKNSGFIIKLISLAVIVGSLAAYQAVVVGWQEEKDKAQAEAKAAAKAAAEKEEAEEKYIDGTYEGVGEGFGGDVKVSVTVSGGKIVSIDAFEHEDEDDAYFNRAVKLLDDIVEANDPEVDTISGATFSSNGLIEATKNALDKAVKE